MNSFPDGTPISDHCALDGVVPSVLVDLDPHKGCAVDNDTLACFSFATLAVWLYNRRTGVLTKSPWQPQGAGTLVSLAAGGGLIAAQSQQGVEVSDGRVFPTCVLHDVTDSGDVLMSTAVDASGAWVNGSRDTGVAVAPGQQTAYLTIPGGWRLQQASAVPLAGAWMNANYQWRAYGDGVPLGSDGFPVGLPLGGILLRLADGRTFVVYGVGVGLYELKADGSTIGVLATAEPHDFNQAATVTGPTEVTIVSSYGAGEADGEAREYVIDVGAPGTDPSQWSVRARGDGLPATLSPIVPVIVGDITKPTATTEAQLPVDVPDLARQIEIGLYGVSYAGIGPPFSNAPARVLATIHRAECNTLQEVQFANANNLGVLTAGDIVSATKPSAIRIGSEGTDEDGWATRIRGGRLLQRQQVLAGIPLPLDCYLDTEWPEDVVLPPAFNPLIDIFYFQTYRRLGESVDDFVARVMLSIASVRNQIWQRGDGKTAFIRLAVGDFDEGMAIPPFWLANQQSAWARLLNVFNKGTAADCLVGIDYFAYGRVGGEHDHEDDVIVWHEQIKAKADAAPAPRLRPIITAANAFDGDAIPAQPVREDDDMANLNTRVAFAGEVDAAIECVNDKDPVNTKIQALARQVGDAKYIPKGETWTPQGELLVILKQRWLDLTIADCQNADGSPKTVAEIVLAKGNQ